jgi:Bifunctional DNA primase/polymerase, N-terminal/AAA domain/Primase C terminal 1 (PriCT-1)
MLEIAKDCLKRGWFVFPCAPASKRPIVQNGFHAASNSEAQIREWWAKWPNANVAIATGASGLTVLDCDHGINDEADLGLFCQGKGLRKTYTVRTGRRDSFGVQMYFNGPGIKSIAWEDLDDFDGVCSGDIRSETGYVMAAGCVHPDSKERYEVLIDAPMAPVPEYVRQLKPKKITGTTGATNPAVQDDGGPITDHRNVAMISLLGRKRSDGADDEAIEEYAHQVNESRMMPSLSESELSKLIENACKFPLPEPEPEIKLGGKIVGALEPVVDWRTRYMTEDAYLNVKPPEFLIDGFLVKKSVAMLAGPVAQRKSIIALNIAHALCSGEPLFGYFDVTGRHERVVYLCPEMGASSFVKRIKQIGLGKYMGKSLFIQTMSEKLTALDELDDELPGAVVIVDTITRFIEGDENKSEDMRKFAQKVFRLMNAGATVVLLHHSKKGSSGSLDDGLRGSSELAAFVDSCWVTDLEDPKKPYESLSKMRNVKQRDFESNPFKLKPAPGSYYLSMDSEPAPEAVLNSKKEEAALETLKKLLAVDPKAGINRLRKALKAAGHGRGSNWVTAERNRILDAGVTLTE